VLSLGNVSSAAANLVVSTHYRAGAVTHGGHQRTITGRGDDRVRTTTARSTSTGPRTAFNGTVTLTTGRTATVTFTRTPWRCSLGNRDGHNGSASLSIAGRGPCTQDPRTRRSTLVLRSTSFRDNGALTLNARRTT